MMLTIKSNKNKKQPVSNRRIRCCLIVSKFIDAHRGLRGVRDP